MSGSGGGGWEPPTSDKCESLAQETILNSPNSVILKQLKKGDVLEVRVHKAGNAVSVQAVYKGQVAGSITSSIIQRIAECIEKGYSYVADVVSLDGGACKVRVHSK